MIELGAGTHIPSDRHFADEVVRHRGGRLVRINPREPAVPGRLDVGLPAGALAGLRSIDSALGSSRAAAPPDR